VRKVPATECAKRLEQVLLGFKAQRKPGEPFNDWCRRVGDQALAKLLAGGKEPPPGDDVEVPKVPESDGPGVE